MYAELDPTVISHRAWFLIDLKVETKLVEMKSLLYKHMTLIQGLDN